MVTPSAGVILDLAREKQAAVRQTAAALDTKATALIGLAGVVLGLLFGSDTAVEHWNWVFSGGAALLGLALVPLGIALFPRGYRANPDISLLLDRYAGRPTADTEWIAAKSIERAISANTRIVRSKARAVRIGSILVAAAILVVAARFVVVLDDGRGMPDRAKGGSPNQKSVGSDSTGSRRTAR